MFQHYQFFFWNWYMSHNVWMGLIISFGLYQFFVLLIHHFFIFLQYCEYKLLGVVFSFSLFFFSSSFNYTTNFSSLFEILGLIDLIFYIIICRYDYSGYGASTGKVCYYFRSSHAKLFCSVLRIWLNLLFVSMNYGYFLWKKTENSLKSIRDKVQQIVCFAIFKSKTS